MKIFDDLSIYKKVLENALSDEDFEKIAEVEEDFTFGVTAKDVADKIKLREVGVFFCEKFCTFELI